MHLATSSSYHPYECTHDKYCEHCTWAETEWHDPASCALCRELGFRLVEDRFAVKVPVNWNLTPYKRKVSVKTTIQEEIPF